MAWHDSEMNDIIGSFIYDQNHVDSSALRPMFRKDEFRTPSPLLPSWHRGQQFDVAAMDEDSNDECYFHSSENIDSNVQRPDVKFVSYGSNNDSSDGNQVIPLEAADNQHLRRVAVELPDSCSAGRRFMKTDRPQSERTCTGFQFSKSRGHIFDGRSKWTLHFIVIFVGPFRRRFCCALQSGGTGRALRVVYVPPNLTPFPCLLQVLEFFL